MFKHTTIFGLLILLLTACTAGVAELFISETAVSTQPVTLEPHPAYKIIVSEGEQFVLTAQAVDPETLADLPEYAPLDFGHHNVYALSPNGRTLALISWHSGYNENGSLQLIDLTAWQVQNTTVTFDAYVHSLDFGPDGRTLYWTTPTAFDPPNYVPAEFALHQYDLDSDTVTAVIPLPPLFSPQEMQLLNGRTEIALYGTSSQIPLATDAVPHLLLVDLTTKTIRADIPLEGVTSGQYRLQNATNKMPYRITNPGLAWDLAQNLLYVVHAAEDKVTVVDLTTAAIAQQVDIAPHQSILERLWSWGVQTAHAKIVPGTDKQAILSPDGRHLFAIGLNRELQKVEEEAHGWIWQETPLGLQIINTQDLTEASVLDLPVTNMGLAPDGKWLLLTGAYDESRTTDGVERVKHGLYVVDTESMAVTSHLLPDREVYLQGFSANGRFAYISTSTSEWQEDQYEKWQTTLHVLDLETGQLTAEREFAGSYLQLIP